jgi:hypothetical protein
MAMGVLLAPEEGQKIRRRLVYQLENLASQVSAFVDQIVAPDIGSEARRTGDALVADARARAQRIRDDIDALLVEMRRQGTPPQPSSTTR